MCRKTANTLVFDIGIVLGNNAFVEPSIKGIASGAFSCVYYTDFNLRDHGNKYIDMYCGISNVSVNDQVVGSVFL